LRKARPAPNEIYDISLRWRWSFNQMEILLPLFEFFPGSRLCSRQGLSFSNRTR
jgi:hypothetical protein